MTTLLTMNPAANSMTTTLPFSSRTSPDDSYAMETETPATTTRPQWENEHKQRCNLTSSSSSSSCCAVGPPRSNISKNNIQKHNLKRPLPLEKAADTITDATLADKPQIISSRHKKLCRRSPEFLGNVNEADANSLRQTLVEQLQARVDPAATPAQFCVRLERILFSQAETLDEHLNLETLDSRLSALVAQRLNKSRAARVNQVLRQARDIKFSSLGGSCCGGGASLFSETQKLPRAVQRFYFGTRLFQQQNKMSLDPHAVPRDVLEKAERHLKDYQEWARQHVPPVSSSSNSLSCSRFCATKTTSDSNCGSSSSVASLEASTTATCTDSD